MTGKEDAALRASVDRLAYDMHRKLKVNCHKGGWEYEDEFELLASLKEEVVELENAMNMHIGLNIIDECADIANFAMMIAENGR